MKPFILIAATFINFLLMHASQAATIPWERDFDSAHKKAKDADKLLLIDFYHPM